MKKLIFISLLCLVCILNINATKKKSRVTKAFGKSTPVKVDKHTGQLRNSKIWNINDCDSVEGGFLFATKTTNGYIAIQLDSNGKLVTALSRNYYSDCEIGTFKDTICHSQNEIYVKIICSSDTLSMFAKSDFKTIIDGSINSNKNSIGFSMDTNIIYKTIYYPDSIIIDNKLYELNIEKEYRNQPFVWNMFNKLDTKIKSILELNNKNCIYWKEDRDLNKYINIAEDDFIFYKKKGYIQ